MLLTCHELTKSYADTVIIKSASFGLENGEKAAITGINGAGKSTLLKMITGEIASDGGEVNLPKTVRMGYLAQQEMLTTHGTIWEAMEDVRRDVLEAENRLREMEMSMRSLTGEALEETMQRYHELGAWFEQENGYALKSEITGILKGLGFSPDEFFRPTAELSGGQRTRIALGRLLLSSPDLILLDEPTNHLDMQSIAWLENYLRAYKGSVLVVAHDRYFLDRVVTKIIEIDRGEVSVFRGNYTDYAKQKKMQREAQLRAWQKQQDQIRHQKDVIEKLRSFNREKSIRRAESREKVLARMDVLDRPSDAPSGMKISLHTDIQSGKDVLMIDHLSKAFDDNLLFKDLSLLIRRGEKVALIGDNGVGKTTLLKIIDGMTTADTGTVRLGTNVTIGYYDQDHQVLHADKTLFDEISDTYPDMDQTQIRNVLASFLFTGDDVFKLTKQLSGGEKGRLLLARLMLSGANLLLLDEPTNHLDMISREILEDALCAYEGTLLYVSHDRYFINRTASRVLEMARETVTDYMGDYDHYLEKKEQMDAKSAQAAAGAADPDTAGQKAGADEKSRWLQAKQDEANRRRQLAQLARLEEQISALEQSVKDTDAQLIEGSIASDPAALLALTKEREGYEAQLEELYLRWEELGEMVNT